WRRDCDGTLDAACGFRDARCRGHTRGLPRSINRERFKRRARVRDVPEFHLFYRIDWNRADNVLRSMNRRASRMQFAAERVVIGVLAMIRFGECVSRSALGLKMVSCQLRFRDRPAMAGRPMRRW